MALEFNPSLDIPSRFNRSNPPRINFKIQLAGVMLDLFAQVPLFLVNFAQNQAAGHSGCRP